MDQELKNRIESALDKVRPHLVKDGGNVEIVELRNDDVLILKYTGACESCKMNFVTLKTGIEETLISEIPTIKSVEAINSINI